MFLLGGFRAAVVVSNPKNSDIRASTAESSSSWEDEERESVENVVSRGRALRFSSSSSEFEDEGSPNGVYPSDKCPGDSCRRPLNKERSGESCVCGIEGFF